MWTSETPVYSIEQIMSLLPHRYPFLLVDRVEEIIRPKLDSMVGCSIRATKNVTFNEPYFPGHFPHKPIMPGVLQVEALAQAAALGIIRPGGPVMDVLIGGVEECRFRRPVVPGDTLEMTARFLKDRGQLIWVEAEASVRGQKACECRFVAKVFPRES